MNYRTFGELFIPPRPMTTAEYAEWFKAERQPAIDAYGLTMQEAADALVEALAATHD